AAVGEGPGTALDCQGRYVRARCQGPRRSPRFLARRTDQGQAHAARGGGVMRRRDAIAGLVAAAALPCLAVRGSAALAQSQTGNGMTRWAYSTEGFERIVHRVEGVEAVTNAIGEGEPLVYFHGGGTFHGFEWIRALANEFRVYAPYHPGFGESGDAAFNDMSDYVAHYELLFPALGLDTFHLAGASMGGHMAARYAAANPGDIDKLVLNAPAGLISKTAAMPDFSKVSPTDL